MEIHRSARRHGIDNTDIEHVVANSLATLDEENEEGIKQVLYLGFNRAGDMCSKWWFSTSTTAATWPSMR